MKNEEKIERSCPCCGGKLIPILYGMPTGEAFKAAERGEIVLGGCCIAKNSPTMQCKDCGKEF